MSETTYVGVGWAWKEGASWRYVTDPGSAPVGAARVELFELGGQVYLHHSTDYTGEFHYGERHVGR